MSFTCADPNGAAPSGIATDSVAGAILSGEGAGQSVTNTGTCVDKAGNVADSATVSGINIDLTRPVISASRLPAANVNGWNNTDVSVTFTCADALSGVLPADDSVAGDNQTFGEGAGQSATSLGTHCVDEAGNAALDKTVSNINVDETKPSVSISSPGDGFNTIASSITVSGTFSDNLSGIYSPNLTVNAVAATLGGSATSGSFSRTALPLSCGANTVTASGTDQAGNTYSTSITVNKLCFGIQYLQPLDQSTTSNPIINTGKYGKVIPVKVVITLGGIAQTDAQLAAYGLNVTIGVNSANCTNGNVTTDVIEAYADAGSANGGTNLFRYSSGQWIYNLDTAHPPAGVAMVINSCYRLDAYINDGSSNHVLLSALPYAIFKPTK